MFRRTGYAGVTIAAGTLVTVFRKVLWLTTRLRLAPSCSACRAGDCALLARGWQLHWVRWSVWHPRCRALKRKLGFGASWATFGVDISTTPPRFLQRPMRNLAPDRRQDSTTFSHHRPLWAILRDFRSWLHWLSGADK